MGELPAGQVIGTNPPEGNTVLPDATIEIRVSTGPPETTTAASDGRAGLSTAETRTAPPSPVAVRRAGRPAYQRRRRRPTVTMPTTANNNVSRPVVNRATPAPARGELPA